MMRVNAATRNAARHAAYLRGMSLIEYIDFVVARDAAKLGK
jgi:hypothetical protein